MDRDEIRYDACLYRTIVVAEAASGLPGDVTGKAPEVPWRNIVGIGNNLKHQYFRVESDIVWDTSVNHFPMLLGSMAAAQNAGVEAPILKGLCSLNELKVTGWFAQETHDAAAASELIRNLSAMFAMVAAGCGSSQAGSRCLARAR